MAKKFTIPDDEREATVASGVSLAYGKTKLSQVQSVSPDAIKLNPHNTLFVTDVNDYERLKNDIATNGITTALHILRDGTLLAGHTRLRIAKELGLRSVPVQYVESVMTLEEQRNYLIRDNLLRRHLSNDDRMSLYRILYPEFDTTFLSEKNRVSAGRTKKGEERLTVSRIAKETGQNVKTVEKQIQRERKKMETMSPLPKKNERQPNVSNFSFKRIQEHLKEVKKLTPTISEKEKLKTRTFLEQILKTL